MNDDQRTDHYQRLAELCREYELLDDEFSELVRLGMKIFQLTDHSCAVLLDFSVPTITKWRQGLTHPGKASRRLAQKEFLRLIEKDILEDIRKHKKEKAKLKRS